MAAILSDLGYRTDHTRGNLYFSPFRDERTPSFHVNDVDHKWCDFGDVDSRGGHPGGDTISLVERLLDCNLPAALAYLERLSASPSIEAYKSEVLSASATKSGSSKICLTGVKNHVSLDALSNYGTYERHIPANILNKYCSQVNFYLEYNNGERSRNRYSIGFPNIDGNWSLRSPMKKGGKLSTGSNYTVIAANGDFLFSDADGKLRRGSATGTPFRPEDKASSVVVTEGFFDALSYLAWKGITVPGDADLVVLNSVTNTQRAMGFVLDHERVVTYLDNDDTGRKFTELIANEVAQINQQGLPVKHFDGSFAFKEYGDLNEAWCAKCRQHQMADLKKKTSSAQTPAITEIRKENGLSYYVGDIKPGPDIVFVFGSNPEGRHGAGAAKVAVERFGAKNGQGEGLQGSAYALPTKDLRVKENRSLRSIPEEKITENVGRLYETARQHPEKEFCVAYRNTTQASLNGYTGREMMKMFLAAGAPPANVVFSQEWAKEILSSRKALAARPAEVQEPAPSVQPDTAAGLLSFSESERGYSGRTYENAQAPDVDFTVAFAEDFNTAGERCTAKAAGAFLIQVDVFKDKLLRDGVRVSADNAAARIYASLPEEYRNGKPLSLNVAGNGIYSLSGMDQNHTDFLVAYTLGALARSGVNIKSLRSGGQTGFDEAAVYAAHVLGVPVHVHAPKGWMFRDADGQDHSGDERAFKARFNLAPEMEFYISIVRRNISQSEGVDTSTPVLFRTPEGKYNYMNVQDRSVLLRNNVDRAEFFRNGRALVSLNGIRLEINDRGIVTRNLTHQEKVRQETGHSIK